MDKINIVKIGGSLINDEKSFTFSISRLLDDSLWLSVATPVKKFLPCASVKCKKIPFR